MVGFGFANRIALTASFAGTALRCSLPPLNIGVFVPLSITVAVLCLARRSWRVWAWFGWFFGLTWLTVLPAGAVGWSWLLAGAAWAVNAAAISIVFAVGGAFARWLPDSLAWLALPLAWSLSAPLLEAAGLPLALVTGWTASPGWLSCARWFGAFGADALATTIGAGLAPVLEHSLRTLPGTIHRAKTGGIAAASAGLVVLVSRIDPGPAHTGEVSIQVVQPAIPAMAFRRAQSSLYWRDWVEERVDTLTAVALSRGANLAVLPEGGNGLFNARLPRRRAVAGKLTENTRTELLLSSSDLTTEGDVYNVVHHLRSGRLVSTVRKVHTVALAEGHLRSGIPTVITTPAARIGISICFDSVFSSHAHTLREKGAEALLVVSDDASFGDSYLAEMHVWFSLLRAIEVGRPLLFLSNAGPVVAATSVGEVIYRQDHRRREAVYGVRLPKADEVTFASRGARWTAPTIACLVGLALLLRKRRSVASERNKCGYTPRPYADHVLAFILLLSGLGGCALLVESGISAMGRGVGWNAALEEMIERAVQIPVQDGLGPIFRQRGDETCGPSALAYVLTMLGDQVYGDQLAKLFAPAQAGGYSLSELKAMAESRGFVATGYSGTLVDLPAPGRPPAIAHMRIGHYVVVLRRESGYVTIFDPATGRHHRVPQARFEHSWSGRYLTVLPRPLDDNWKTLDHSAL